MRATRGRISIQLALFAGAAIAILAGASFNVQGRTAETSALALLAGLLAFVAGVLYQRWRISLPMAVAAAVTTIASYHLDLKSVDLQVDLAGLLSIFLGGMLGILAYQEVSGLQRAKVTELETLNEQLEEQHRIFLAATEDTSLQAGNLADMAVSTARQMDVSICCYFLASPDGQQFMPQTPGLGLDRVRAQAVTRARRKDDTDPLLTAIEANQPFYAESAAQLHAVFDYMPPDFAIRNALLEPIRVGEHIGGFILLANREGGFSADDRRLATTLAMRAGAHLAAVHAVALSQKEAARYALLNELVKTASGKTLQEVLALVQEMGSKLVRYDASRIAMFHGDGTYVMSGGSDVPSPLGGSQLEKVMEGGTVLRKMVTSTDGLFSGLEVGTEGAAVAEALTPIRGASGVLGAICLGRKGGLSFGARDVPALEELGAMAGVAIENSRILQQVSGQATKLDVALDALGEMSKALTSVTEGPAVLEEKTLAAAARLQGCSHALMTTATGQGRHAVTSVLGFPAELLGMEIQNGQGLVGSVLLSGRAVAVPDALATFELSSPPDLSQLGLHGAICVPMVQGDELWGTLSVFDTQPRNWSDDDVRVLSTLGNEAVVAVKNAELYDSSRKMIWEITNLHEGLKAVTSTLDLDQVMELVLGWAAKASGAQIGCLALQDESGKLQLLGAYGTDHSTAAKLALELGNELCLDVMSSGKPLMEAMDQPAGAGAGPLEPRAVLCVPINLREKPIGVVFLSNYVVGRPFSDDHKRLVTALAAQAAVAIDNARLFRDREEVMLSALNALASAVDARDPYTAGHSHRVTEYSVVIARQLGYAPGDEAAWRRLRHGTELHDIGKIGVPDAVLSKPGKLTDAEFAMMKSHPVKGFEVLRGLKMLSDELKIVRSHHERFDGRGYPDRLKGPQLPIYVWAVSAADALDAMTSDRPYRKGMSLEVALAEISKGAGSHFHPEVAAAVLAAAKTGSLKLIPQQSLYQDAPIVGAFENPSA